MKKVFDYYTDPGHGWVKVPMNILKRLNIQEKITGHSYWRKGFAYLEEDCDMATLINAHPEKKLLKFNTHNSNKSSRIRNYESYKIELA